jgi:hypothetical protein
MRAINRYICVHAFASFVALLPAQALAWSAPGHQLVGAIAQAELRDNARQQVTQILGYDLSLAAKWPDCVRNVAHTDGSGFHYNKNTPFQAPCTGFMAPSEVARMEDYASRNWNNCPHREKDSCAASYHFADVAIERSDYHEGPNGSFVEYGTNDHDVVHAIQAAIDVLQDRPALPPFSIKDKKEALLMLAHFVGDEHQPLHVGAIYLTTDGSEMDPDSTPGNHDANGTSGGNFIMIAGKNLHSTWDQTPASWTAADFATAASAVPPTAGSIMNWPIIWARDTVMASHQAFKGLQFGAEDSGGKWTATAQANYAQSRVMLQQSQIAKGGARLAQLLNAIWPTP